MSLYPEPLQAILDNIKLLNPGVELTEDEYIFGNPVVIPTTATGINTQMHITSKDASSPFAGETDVKHIRLNLADLLVLVPADLAIAPPLSTLEFAQALNKIYGLNFTANDIVDEQVSLPTGAGTITLTAATNSRGWIGSVTFNVTPGRYKLEQYLLNTRLNGLNYPDPYQAKPFGNAYNYWRDYSAQYELLDILLTGEQGDLTNVKDALVANTGDAWVTTGKSRFSLQGSEITYVGNVSGYPEANQLYEKVVVVLLGADCLGYSGRMFFHYNLPSSI